MANKAITDIYICNMALGYVGNANKIRSFDEQTQPASICSTYYDITRASLLAEYAWKFATITADLVLVTDETHDVFQYVYEYPDDCLAVQKIFAKNDGDNVTNKFETETVPGETAYVQRIYCDVPEAKIKYTYDVQDCGAMPFKFVKALAYCLAAEIVLPLGALPFVQVVKQEKAIAVMEARKACALEQKKELQKQNPYISARR